MIARVTTSLRFGLSLAAQHRPEDSQAARFAEHVEQVRRARAVGFSSVWVTQHYLSAPFTYFQPLPLLARLLPEAEGMTVGTAVLVLPLHQPVDLAEQLATLDVMSSGRLVVGVGLGYRDAENRAMGHEPRARVGRMEESLTLLERLWTGEPVTYAGKHFRLDDVRLSMRPLQRPRPPLWLAADADGGVRRAARLGDTWLLNAHATLPTLARQLALFAAARREAGRPPADEIPLKRECFVAPDDATALREGAPFIDEKYAAYRQWGQDAALPPDESFSADVRELMRDRFLIGDPSHVRDEIARYRQRLGITTMIFRVQWPGMDQTKVLRTIRLLGEKVLPMLT